MFRKGTSGNANGRPKGARDKKKSSLLEKVRMIVDGNMETIQHDIDQLEPAERIRAITGLINYVLPKQQSATPMEIAEAEYSRLEVLLDTAPDEAIDEIVTRIEHLKTIENGRRREKKEDSEDYE